MVHAFAVLAFVLSLLASAGAAQADIDHCVTNEGSFLRNLCDFKISVRYCCYGSEWYACDHSAKINWGEDPGYHEWLSPGETATMACNPEVAGWRWAGCQVSDDSYELAPYGWDMQSTRGLRCARDGDSGTPQAQDGSGTPQAQDSSGTPQAQDSSGEGLAGRWIKYNDAAASFHDDLLQACGYGTHNEFRESNRTIYTSVVSNGTVLDESAMEGWSVISMSPDRISFQDSYGEVWHYDHCR